MKSYPYHILTALCLGATGVLFADAPLPAPLINAVFESPTNNPKNYPPAPGENWSSAGGMSGWSNDGKLLLMYGTGYGLDGTGGVYVKIDKLATNAMLLTYTPLKFPMFKDGLPLVDPIRSIRFSVDMKMPVGKSFEVHIQFNVPKDVDAGGTAWGNRIVLGAIKGTGSYQTYAFSGADLSDGHVAKAVNYIRNLYLNGASEMSGNLSFAFDVAKWAEGDEVLMDNLKLAITGQ